MKKLKQSLLNWLPSGLAKQKSNAILGYGEQISSGLSSQDGTVNFSVHPASGGYVVETSYYNEITDRHERQLYIITSQEDFSSELGKAVFMSMLRK
jgi:hypothetical protein